MVIQQQILYYIQNGLTENDVTVSIDGAHVKTGNQVHFDIVKFLRDNDCVKVEGIPSDKAGGH